VDRDVREAAAAIAGAPMDAFFDRYVHATEELPLPELWRRAGLRVRARAEWDEAEKPPADRDPVRAARARAWTGIALHPDRTVIRNVLPESPAWRAGLTFNDEIVAVDGCRVTAATFAKRVGDSRPGDRARIAFFRRDLLEERTLTLAESPERKWTIEPDPRAPERAQAVRAGWLGTALRYARGARQPNP
jgi:predicted metalloprotease with PDZ domain